MAYRVWVRGVPIDCDAPEEAIELAKLTEGEDVSFPGQPPKRSENTEGSRWTEKRVKEFFNLIEGRQKKLIDALLEHKDGQTDDQLCALLPVSGGQALAGVFAGLWKNAKKAGADPNDLYEKKAVTIGGKRAFEYFLTESFRRVAEQAK